MKKIFIFFIMFFVCLNNIIKSCKGNSFPKNYWLLFRGEDYYDVFYKSKNIIWNSQKSQKNLPLNEPIKNQDLYSSIENISSTRRIGLECLAQIEKIKNNIDLLKKIRSFLIDFIRYQNNNDLQDIDNNQINHLFQDMDLCYKSIEDDCKNIKFDEENLDNVINKLNTGDKLVLQGVNNITSKINKIGEINEFISAVFVPYLKQYKDQEELYDEDYKDLQSKEIKVEKIIPKNSTCNIVSRFFGLFCRSNKEKPQLLRKKLHDEFMQFNSKYKSLIELSPLYNAIWENR